jgi:hypothetical protein
MSARHFARFIATLLITAAAASAAALAPDERRRERILGDDDPIIVPGSFAIIQIADPFASDPDTTGSVDKRLAKKRQLCDRFAFYPDRPPGEEFREAC